MLPFIEKAYRWFFRVLSKADENKGSSAGFWQDEIRKQALIFSRDLKGRLIEIGCGEGLFLSGLKQINKQLLLFGLDRRAELLGRHSFLNQDQDVRFFLSDATLLSVKEDMFDAAVLINVSLSTPEAVLRVILKEMSRVVKTGGRIIFDFRNARNVFVRLKYALVRFYDPTITTGVLYSYDPDFIKNLFCEYGIKVSKSAGLGWPGNAFSPVFLIQGEKI